MWCGRKYRLAHRTTIWAATISSVAVGVISEFVKEPIAENCTTALCSGEILRHSAAGVWLGADNVRGVERRSVGTSFRFTVLTAHEDMAHGCGVPVARLNISSCGDPRCLVVAHDSFLGIILVKALICDFAVRGHPPGVSSAIFGKQLFLASSSAFRKRRRPLASYQVGRGAGGYYRARVCVELFVPR